MEQTEEAYAVGFTERSFYLGAAVTNSHRFLLFYNLYYVK